MDLEVILPEDIIWEAISQMMNLDIGDVDAGHECLNFLIRALGERKVILKYQHDDNIKHLFINTHTLRRLRTLIIHRGEFEFDSSETSEYMKNFIFQPVSILQLYKASSVSSKNLPVSSKKKSHSASGAMFKFLNLSSHDLSRYQIYARETLPASDDHCLIRSLKLQGINTATIYGYVSCHYFSRHDLSIIADKLKVNIILYRCDDVDNYQIKTSRYPRSQKYPIVVKIALYSDHYFVHEKIKVGGRVTTSLKFVYDLMNSEMFELYQPSFELLPNFCHLGLIMGEQNPFLLQEKKSLPTKVSISYGDIECIIRPRHIPMMYGAYRDGKYTAISRGADLDWSGLKSYLNSFPAGYNIVYFHNLKYDWSVIRSCPAINLQQILRKDGLYYKVIFRYYGNKIFELRDSCKLIPKKLADFTKAFALKCKKYEYILYDLYTIENTMNESVSYHDYDGSAYDAAYDVTESGYDKRLKPIINKDDYIILDHKIVVHREILSLCGNYFYGGQYYHLAHCEYYLKLDCEILMKGMMIFREKMLELLEVDCHQELTLPSMIHRRICSDGAYDEVYQLKDNLRDFVTKSVHGGRVCCKDNKVWDVRGKIYVLDGKSLYPSAIERICREGGFPAGPCNVITDWSEMPNFAHYVVKINITKIGIQQQIPFVNYYHDGCRVYTNNVPSEGYLNGVTVDKLTLEDWITYQNIEFDFVEGVYWTAKQSDICTDKSPPLGKLIRDLYQARQEYIKDSNVSMNEIIKLVLNSLYGKTIVKATNTKIIVKDNDKVNNYIAKNFNNLIDMETCHNQSILTVNKIGLGHENMAHVGGMILSMARRIMNEAMSLANSLNIHILYQDTDSMHIVDSLDNNNTYRDKLNIFKCKYFKTFGRELIGEDLGQFGLDLKYSEHRDIHSVRALILGKKVYLHVVKGTKNDPSGQEVEETYNYMRIKGVNSYALDEYPDSLSLYERLYNGETIKFDLTYGNGVMFKFTETSVTTRETYIKEISFEGERHRL